RARGAAHRGGRRPLVARAQDCEDLRDHVSVSIRFLGSGNAFADGGRSHACIHVSAPGVSLLLDCGGSSLPMIKRYVDPAQITAIAVTHLHGDHFGGIPFLLDEQKWAGRKQELVIGGPPSLEARTR